MFTARIRQALVAIGAVGLLTVPGAIATISVAAAAGSNTLTVTAGEYTYKLSGKPKPGNVEVVFDNQGVELHMMAVFPLKAGVTDKQLQKAALSDDQSALEKISAGDGSPLNGLPSLLSPDVKSTNIGNLKAGHYGIMCFVPAPDGSPHIAHGMVKTFDVSGSKSALKPPTDGVAEVSISDTAITLPSTGLPKTGWVKVTNNASVGRDFTVAKLASGATFEQADSEFDTFFETGAFPSGSAPATLHAGISNIAPGTSAYVQVTTDSGSWFALSSDSDGENELNAPFTV